MTESYVAGVFATLVQAETAREQLTRLADAGGVVLHGARIYSRSSDGDLDPISPQDVADSALLDPSGLPGGTDDEAIAELSRGLPNGSCALLAHVEENTPAPVDELLRSAGGTVFRRSVDDVEASGFHRFLDASSLT